MKKLFLLLLAIFSTSAVIHAQNQTAIGARLGIKRAGLTIQQDIGERSKLEGLLTISKEDVTATGLYEYHHPVGPEGLTVYGGIGAHVGKFYNLNPMDIVEDILNPESSKSGAFTGLDLIGGVQYKIPFLPANVSLDVKPALHLNNHPNKFQFQAGLSLRFFFGSGGGSGSGSGSGTGSNGGGGYETGTGGGYPGGAYPSPSPSPTPERKGKVKTRDYPAPTTKPTNPKPSPKPTPQPSPNPTPTNDGDKDRGGNSSGDDNENNNGESWGDGGN